MYILLLLLFGGALWSSSEAQYTPKDNYLIDCGSSTSSNVSSRLFTDESKFVSGGKSISGTLQTNGKLDADQQTLYSTARVFSSEGSYSFSITPGRHWIRLHFFPFTSSGADLTSAFFSVTAGGYLLMSNHSVSGELASISKSPISPSSPPYLLKEYSINVTSDRLSVGFQPSPGSIAFVNALEVVSVPGDVYKDDGTLVGIGSSASVGLGRSAIQTMHRLNVGGQTLSPILDSGLSRTWIRDDFYLVGSRHGTTASPVNDITYPPLVPQYTAPVSVYGTARTMGVSDSVNTQFNLTWSFPVDSGYNYFVRMHFAEIVYTATYSRIFDVFINGLPATKGLDVVVKAGAAQTAMFMDFVVQMNDGGNTVLVEMGPSPSGGAQHNESILNGIEIFKVNNSRGSLAGMNIPPGIDLSNNGAGSGRSSSSGAIAGGVAAGVAVMGLVAGGLCYMKRRKSLMGGKKKKKAKTASWLPLHAANGNSTSIASKYSSKSGATGSVVSTATSSLGGKFFTFAEILEATNNFDESLLLGVGGFGKVYRGELFDGTKVAVKRGNPRSEQGLTEFQTEIEMLSKLRHRHLVSLIGYCEEHCEMILVYECMANGTLRAHLYGSDLPPLSWKQRLEICIGAARGLHYLHTGAAQGIIHRDVKTTNILLDENFVSKVSDFGLSKTGPSLDRTHVSTAVKGSFGYLDPEYFRRQQLTEKSDVYSFGVVLFEVLCARPAINPALPREQVNIAEWAMQYQRMGMLEQIVDPHLKGQYNVESLRKFGETAEKCLAEQGIDRPAMGDVLWNLEYALQLHENAVDPTVAKGDVENVNMELPLRSVEPDYHHHLGEDDFEDASASAVFSQLVNPQGR